MAAQSDAAEALKVLIFLGSARSAPPFWNAESKPGMPGKRVGDRVVAFVRKSIEKLNEIGGGPALEVLDVVDPLSSAALQSITVNNGNPTYYHSPKPEGYGEDLKKLLQQVQACDAIVVVCPEYNHTIPPALTMMMNHIGCSHYANKVSCSVTYSGFSSAGGGARCAVALRPYLSELGCLPVSKQVIIPNATVQVSADGEAQGDHASGLQKTMTTMLEQLRWWSEAARSQRGK